MFDSFLDISSSFNIYDADSITREIFVYEGQESPNSVYFATGYMKCKGGDTLHVQFETPQGVRVDLAEYTSFADIRYMGGLDENKVYITGAMSETREHIRYLTEPLMSDLPFISDFYQMRAIL